MKINRTLYNGKQTSGVFALETVLRRAAVTAVTRPWSPVGPVSPSVAPSLRGCGAAGQAGVGRYSSRCEGGGGLASAPPRGPTGSAPGTDWVETAAGLLTRGQ